MLAVLDYGAGNLRSVVRALAFVGADPIVISDPDLVRRAGALVFPGVGAAGSAMRRLREQGLDEAIREFHRSGRPVLGVCLGLQLLFEWSEEDGGTPGLGLFPGQVRRFPNGLKVPHMGWNRVRVRQEHPLFAGIPDGTYFYFVHSYYAEPADEGLIVGTTDYGVEFASVVARDHLVATQFHPEKSGRWGLAVYANFLRKFVGLKC
jgi:glutamine amidotransferase